MTRTTAAQARAEIVGTARHLFAEFGYEGTSLQDIATELGGSKAGVLYHFGTKALILHELMVPAAESLAKLVDELDRLDPEPAQRRALEGFVDLVLEYRHELSAYPAAIQQIIELPELADLRFRQLGERLLAAMTRGSTATVDLIAAHVVCIGLLATTVTLTGLDPSYHSDSDSGLERDPETNSETDPEADPRRAGILVDLEAESLRSDLLEVAERALALRHEGPPAATTSSTSTTSTTS